MKQSIKRLLKMSGLWYPFIYLRSVVPVVGWLKSGCGSVAPQVLKWICVRFYVEKYQLKNFVETGTYVGDTLDYIAKAGIKCTSIELSKELYKAACNRFKGVGNIRLLQGDSGKVLPQLLEQISEPTLFWLDGHYSGGTTARGDAITHY